MERDTNKLPHTPGPWLLVTMMGKDPKEERLIVRCVDDGKEWIARVLSNNSDADAKLIAAAPDMLEVLQEVRRHGLIEKDGYETLVKKLGNVISKATE